MERRRFLGDVATLVVGSLIVPVWGCRSNSQVAHVLNEHDRDMVGSHTAGAETWEPLIEQSVSELLAKESTSIQPASFDGTPSKKKVCFVSISNKGCEEMGDYGENMYDKMTVWISDSEMFAMVNRRYVEAGLRACGLRPDDLFLPENQRKFAAAMEKTDQPIDYLLYGNITTATTKSNGKDYQRKYQLTLELVNIHNPTDSHMISKELRKGYHKSNLGKLKHYG